MADKQAEGLLGCIAVPLVVAFFLYAVWPSRQERQDWKNTLGEIEANVRTQDSVSARLRDPGSAEYSDGRASARLANVRCGRVNATNGFGGRTGPQRYIRTPTDTLLEADMSPGEMDRAWASMC